VASVGIVLVVTLPWSYAQQEQVTTIMQPLRLVNSATLVLFAQAPLLLQLCALQDFTITIKIPQQHV
jgi:hypothetical protein